LNFDFNLYCIALRAGKCYSVIKNLYLPTAPTKSLSPLDNSLWHSFKEVIRNQHIFVITDLPLLLSQIFHSLTKQEI
jgi:hypothetical protein